MKIAIIDIIGIPYDGTTVYKQGLGGSESAVTFASEQLAKLGFDVTVFNNCDSEDTQPGTYNGVVYRPTRDLAKDWVFDIVISSRTVIPFTDPKDYPKLNDNRTIPFQSMNLYDRILSKAKMRILWMHDTFCLGDLLIEPLTVQDRITDIFTLSDWHLTYITNCDHGARRNFEVLKPKVFITRNGVNIYDPHTDLKNKDPDLFVYNASVTKGMVPLVKEIWPRVKQQLPNAKLKIIGGYYRFGKSSAPDQQEQDWHVMANDPVNKNLDIEFTGVISQKSIAHILQQSSFMIYPSAFPETFGISSVESLCYNTPLITCRFGALEEIALAEACYVIDYSVVPNNLFPNINSPQQIEKFVATTVQAYRDRYLHQQKQNYCNIIKDIVGWDTVALQWKQHIYYKLKQHLPVDEYRAVQKINQRIHKIWKRRYTNLCEMSHTPSYPQQKIEVISPFYNAEHYLENHILSVAAQDYDNWEHTLIDDCSTDQSIAVIERTIASLPEHIQGKYKIVKRTSHYGAVKNQIETVRSLEPNSVVMLLDGDDSLTNDNSIFHYYNDRYLDGAEFTYGSCWSLADNIPLIAQEYPQHVKETRAYRTHHFNWILPYTHLRTFRKSLLDTVDDEPFKDAQGEWYDAGGDGSVFYALIEQADPNSVLAVQDIMVNYNDVNPLNDYKVNATEQNKNAREIVNMNQTKKKILIAIPTAKYIEPETFKSIYDLDVPEGYQTVFQYFYGYNIDQVRNLIADWVVKGYDYLLSVDSDIVLPRDTLTRFLAHDVDIVSGLYIQRKPGQHILELYENNDRGGVSNIPYGKIKDKGLVPIGGCGFGCVLIKQSVFKGIPYPHFVYHSALDHANTISEDVDFCAKALKKGFKIYADTTMKCRHVGQSEFLIDDSIPAVDNSVELRLRDLSSQRLLPKPHVDYLQQLKDSGFTPKTIYDVGACVLHWTNEATQIWPESEIVAFEAMPSCEFLYKDKGIPYHIGVLSNESNKTVEFYQNDQHPGGNSYYIENSDINANSAFYFNETHKRTYQTVTLDAVFRLKQLPKPELLKMDVQGAELDVLRGAEEVLESVEHVILELQSVEYNKGAPLREIVIQYMYTIGFELVAQFTNYGPDGDYHFKRR
jgi:FkbM family methyltransferase